jgi:hypothetical protein
MQQRQLRLGDILDDYCPRERRITNHAVVAMIGDEVRQTRCTTCDADHEYKHAKVPATRKKKDTVSAAFSEVLAAVQQDAPAGAIRLADPVDEKAPPRRRELKPVTVPEPEPEQPDAPPEPPAEPTGAEPEPVVTAAEEAPAQDEGPVHRRLIRATLPRTDTPVARPVPQFTMREPAPRGGHFRSKGGHRPHQGGGAARPHGRPAGPKHAAGSRKGGLAPHPRPSRPGHGAHAPRPGKKHSR